jgi:hypothetical protein
MEFVVLLMQKRRHILHNNFVLSTERNRLGVCAAEENVFFILDIITSLTQVTSRGKVEF